MPPTQNLRRRGALVLAVSMFALLLSAPLASAASFAEGTTTVKLSPAFKRFLKKSNVKLAVNNIAAKNTLTFKISDGTATLQSNSVGFFAHSGSSLRFSAGTKRLTLTSIRHTLSGTRGALTGGVNSKGLALLAEAAAGKTGANAEFSQLTGTNLPAKLTPPAVRALNNALKLKGNKAFKKNQPVGTVSFRSDRRLEVLGTGNATTRFSPEYIDQLQACGVTQTVIAPGEATGPTDDAPRGRLRLPIAGGNLNARTLLGTVGSNGGVQLSKGEKKQSVVNFTFDFKANERKLTADVPDINLTGLAIATLDGGTITKNLDPEGGTVSLSGVVIRFDPLAANTLSAQFGCNIPPGTPLGTVDAQAAVK